LKNVIIKFIHNIKVARTVLECLNEKKAQRFELQVLVLTTKTRPFLFYFLGLQCSRRDLWWCRPQRSMDRPRGGVPWWGRV